MYVNENHIFAVCEEKVAYVLYDGATILIDIWKKEGHETIGNINLAIFLEY